MLEEGRKEATEAVKKIEESEALCAEEDVNEMNSKMNNLPLADKMAKVAEMKKLQ